MQRWLVSILCLAVMSNILIFDGNHVAAQGNLGQPTLHIVQQDETLYSIARLYSTSVEVILQTNGLSTSAGVLTGQRLLIPSSHVQSTIPTSAQYTIQPGDTLAQIALRYNTTPEVIAHLNNLVNPAQWIAGQQIHIGLPAPDISDYKAHIVEADDTLQRIAIRYGMRLSEVIAANQLQETAVIIPGQILVIPVDSPASTQALPSPLSALVIGPLPLEVGRTSKLHIRTTSAATIEGTLLEQPLHFSASEDQITFDALIGVHALTEPGRYPLLISIDDGSGTPINYNTELLVVDGRYAFEEIVIDDELLALLDPELNTSEYDLIADLVSGFTPERSFNGPMGLPAAAPVTSLFGVRRSYNNSPYNRFHTGTDFGGPPDSHIFAPSTGLVVFSDWLDIHGLFTVIDHGWGVYTAYAHQTTTFVSPGQYVTPGQMIGTIGSTGRSTGPHLHWEVWVNGIAVDGLQWTRHDF